jgi:nuclear transcription Y subunit beta
MSGSKSPEDGSSRTELREQDKWLPIANVSRIMKNALPENAKVSKEAKECVQECVSEFVSFITSEASEKCCAEKRKTVNGEDILFAMTSLGFENYSEVLKIYLAKYRVYQVTKQEKQDKKKGAGGAESGGKTEDEFKDEEDSYQYEESFQDERGDAIYEEYSGQYTNVDMSQF